MSAGDAARQRFARDGYLSPLTAVSPAQAAASHAQLQARLGADGRAGAGIRNSPHLLFPWAADLVRHPAVLDAVADLLGPDLLVLRSTLFVKAPHDPGIVDWHQDALYWDLDGARVLTAWIALTDSVAASGAVQVLPGSHHGGVRPHDLRADAHNRLLRGHRLTGMGDAPATLLELRAGEFSLHDRWLAHASGPNASDAPRIGLAVRYIATGVAQRGPRQVAMLVRGVDRHGFYPLAPAPRADDPAAARATHRWALRRYAFQVAWQAARQPSVEHLRLIGRLAMRRDLLRAVFGHPRA